MRKDRLRLWGCRPCGTSLVLGCLPPGLRPGLMSAAAARLIRCRLGRTCELIGIDIRMDLEIDQHLYSMDL